MCSSDRISRRRINARKGKRATRLPRGDARTTPSLTFILRSAFAGDRENDSFTIASARRQLFGFCVHRRTTVARRNRNRSSVSRATIRPRRTIPSIEPVVRKKPNDVSLLVERFPFFTVFSLPIAPARRDATRGDATPRLASPR